MSSVSGNSDPGSAPRSVHLVGTIPAPSTLEALRLADATLEDTLRHCVPDGETGDRLNWINRIIESLRTHPDLELARDGDWTDYEDTPAFKVKRGRRFDEVGLDYVDAFHESWPVFREWREIRGGELALQVGIPGHIDLAFVAFGFKLRRGLRNLGPFREATVREISRIHAIAGNDVVFQLEVPIELIMLTRLPRPLRRFAATRLAREAVRVVEGVPAGTRFGVHLCYGDLNHEALGSPKDSTPLVLLANALVRHWPAGRELDFIHGPFALGKEPPPFGAAYYQPLADLALPGGVRFIGGFVHEARTVEELVGIRDEIENLVGRRIDVAASCGLGRRDLERARRNMELARSITA